MRNNMVRSLLCCCPSGNYTDDVMRSITEHCMENVIRAQSREISLSMHFLLNFTVKLQL
jgi:hypothetical protein